MRKILVLATAVAASAASLSGGSAPALEPVTCFGEQVTHLGTTGHDDIDLSEETGPQVVNGLEGDDSITGGTAADVLCGGPGIDEVYGEAGKDSINTGPGRDYGTGEGGADLVKGRGDKEKGVTTWRIGAPDEGAFEARLDGGEGNDRIFGGDGNDAILGEDGDDTIRGDAGTDACKGGPGDNDVDCEKRLRGQGRHRREGGSPAASDELVVFTANEPPSARTAARHPH